MESKKVVRKANIINVLLIILAIVMYVLFNVMSLLPYTMIDIGIWGLYILAAIILLVFACITFSQMRKLAIKGGGCMLAAAIITMIFSIFSFTLGIIVWILAGISMKQIRDSEQEIELMAKMQQQAAYTNNGVDTTPNQL